VCRGTGQQRLASYITSSAYWAFGIPISLLFVFVFDSGIRGLWFGPTFAVTYNTIAYAIIISRIKWPEMIQKAKEARERDRAAAASSIKEKTKSDLEKEN